MPAISLTAFRGEQPRIIPRLLPETAAQSAINARLDDGGLTPMKVPIREVGVVPDHQTIYRHGTTWLSWSGVVNAAPGAVAQDRLYYTGDGAPKMRVGDDVYELALPSPDEALTATLGGSGDGDVATRLYGYTWVTAFGEESEPCPVSNAVDWKPGNTVTLSGFAEPPPDRQITLQRIYRSQTGRLGTYFYLIAERAASDDAFEDNIAVDALQEPLPSAEWNPPPADLVGLISMPNGMMAAHTGNDVYFCEPYRPHAWPEKYVLTTEVPIVGLAAIGTYLIVLTEGQPYLATGSSPETMQMVKLESTLPCINARGIVDMGFAVAYPSHEGLVAARADGSIGIVSGRLFDRDSWLALSPETMIGALHGGRYVAFYDTVDAEGGRNAGALFIDIQADQDLIRSSEIATAAFYDISDGGLYFLGEVAGDVYRLDAPAGSRHRLYWRSKPFILPYPENFGAIRIDSADTLSGEEKAAAAAARDAAIAANAALIAAGSIGGEMNGAAINALPMNGDILQPMPEEAARVTVGIIADGQRVVEIERTNAPTRLPSGFRAETWEIDVASNVKITRITMAKTMDELKSTP